jgi:arylsulfatase A-like enzyme
VGDHVNGTFREDVDYTDVLVGRLLDALEDMGLKKNTLVIFTSDNGTPDKNHATNAGSRVPLLIDFPGTVQQRGFSDELISLSDILPTLVDFAGGEVPEGYKLDGISMKPFLTGQAEAHREYLFNYLGTARLVRTKDWLLEAVDEVYGMPEGRLYDCRFETNNGRQVREPMDDDAARARESLWEILEAYPPLDTNLQKVKDIMPYYDGYIYRHRLD